MKFEEFEELVENILENNKDLQCIVMTDSFFDNLCYQAGRIGFTDFRRILGVPICCLPNNEVFDFSPNKGKFKVDYKFVGIRTRWV